MKICMCGETFKRLMKFARKGGLKGLIKKTTQSESGKKKRKASKSSGPKRRKSSKGRGSGKIHFMRVPIGPKGKKNRKTRRQAYIIKKNGQRKFVKNPK